MSNAEPDLVPPSAFIWSTSTRGSGRPRSLPTPGQRPWPRRST